MELAISKVLTAVVLFILTLLFSLIPYYMVLRGSQSFVSARLRNGVIAYLNCLAGGVFLGTFLLHILTEGSEEFDKYKESVKLETDYPLFNLCVAGGFFLVAFVELFVHLHLHHRHQERFDASDEGNATVHSAVGETDNILDVPAEVQPVTGSYGAIGSSHTGYTGHREHPQAHHSNGDTLAVGFQSSAGKDSETVRILQQPNMMHTAARSDSHHHEIQGSHPPGVRAFLLLIALSFHTIFDGLAVGLQTSTAEVWSVFFAISIHKSVIAFCLGLELFQTNTEKPWKAIVWLVFFGLMSPLGIGIGIELTSDHINETAKLLASSILQGLAGGTFLYVTFLEILCMHIGHQSTGNFFYVFFTFVGFAIMAATKLLDHD